MWRLVEIFVVFIIVMASVVSVLAAVGFQRTYGGPDGERGYSVAQTPDGGYLVSGATFSYGAGSADVYVIKTDSLGDTLWTKTYGGSGYEEGRSIALTSDGGYVITGLTSSYGAGSLDIYIVKADSLGDILWTKTYGGTNDEWGQSVVPTSDGGYIIAGYTSSFGANPDDIYLVKTDSLGDSLWTKTYGGTGDDRGYSVAQTLDEGYVVTGEWDTEVCVMKADAFGDTLWTRTFGTGTGRSIIQASDGGYVIAGDRGYYDAAYVIKTDNYGDTLWTRTFESVTLAYAQSVTQTSDGRYVVAGKKDEMPWMVKLSRYGSVIWSQKYLLSLGPVAETFYEVRQTADGGYVAVGWAIIVEEIQNEIYLVKTGTQGQVGVCEAVDRLPGEFSLSQNYPNPFNPTTHISYSLPRACLVRLDVYDLLGQKVSTLVDEYQQAGHRKVLWDGSDHASGVYLYRLQAGEFNRTRTMVLVK